MSFVSHTFLCPDKDVHSISEHKLNTLTADLDRIRAEVSNLQKSATTRLSKTPAIPPESYSSFSSASSSAASPPGESSFVRSDSPARKPDKRRSYMSKLFSPWKPRRKQSIIEKQAQELMEAQGEPWNNVSAANPSSWLAESGSSVPEKHASLAPEGLVSKLGRKIGSLRSERQGKKKAQELEKMVDKASKELKQQLTRKADEEAEAFRKAMRAKALGEVPASGSKAGAASPQGALSVTFGF